MLTREQFDNLRAQGLTVEQIIKFENGFVPGQEKPEQKGFASGVADRFKARAKDIYTEGKELKAKSEAGTVNPFTKKLAEAGLGAKLVAETGYDVVFSGLSRLAEKISGVEDGGQKTKDLAIKKAEAFLQTTNGKKVLSAIQKGEAAWNEFVRNNPNLAETAKATLRIAEFFPPAKGGKEALKLGKEVVETTADAGKRVAVNTAEYIGDTAKMVGEKIETPLTAATQKTSEFIERVPRAIDRAKDATEEAALRAERIRTATPEVANAIKSNLDERIINTVVDADDATKQAYKRVVDIAEEAGDKIGMKKQPSIVSGELASEQFDIINKQKKEIGKQLGDKIKELSKTDVVDMQGAYSTLDDVLYSQGIEIAYTKKGPKLNFSGTKFTPAERTKIQELYNLATEGGAALTPNSIHGKDQLFSKLQREAAMEGVGKIMVDTPEGAKSLFGIFRDVFSSNLDDISPEIRNLNKQYRDLILAIDDIEDSIFRTPNFNITKAADQAEFAKVNLRRIFGEAQSSPVFEAVADNMDKLARELGYSGATPKQVAEFANEIRKLYPETVPKTGFTGAMKTGLSNALLDAANTVFKAGAPNIDDQRKALIQLLKIAPNK